MKYVNLSGDLIDDSYAEIFEWFGFKNGFFSQKTVRNALAEANGEEITFYINSDGGMLCVGSEIYGLLAEYSGDTTAHIQSRSASAATVMMQGCRHIIAEPVSLVCVHNPSTREDGDARVFRKTAHELDNIKESIINAYMPRISRVGGTRESISALMDKNEWLDVAKAKEYGLIDEVKDRAVESIIINAVSPLSLPSQRMIDEFLAAKAENAKSEREREALVNRARAFIEINR